MTIPKKIAFIGIGLMGLPMAKHLLAAGHQVVVWNRTPAKAAALTDHGGVVAETPEQAVQDADLIITMLSDGAVVDAILQAPELQAALQQGSLWVDMSSTQPVQARAQSARLEKLGIAHLDAPVSGGTKGAEAASLAIMVGGQEETFLAALPILSIMGRPVHVGPSGSGQLAKLANQLETYGDSASSGLKNAFIKIANTDLFNLHYETTLIKKFKSELLCSVSN